MKDEFLFADPTMAGMTESPAFAVDKKLPDSLASLIDPLDRIRSLEKALDSLGQALVLLGKDAKILYASSHAMRILAQDDGLTIVEEVFHASMEEDRLQLSSALGTLLERGEASVKLELNIRRPSGKLPYKLRVNALLDTQQALAIIHDTNANHMAWYDRLQARFQLTPRECECTMLLTDGYSMAEIAERMSISMQTLRQHLKHAFNKTGTHKQHELVGIVLQMQRKR
jgi:DNA-binding CsgD family transcriptional regulator